MAEFLVHSTNFWYFLSNFHWIWHVDSDVSCKEFGWLAVDDRIAAVRRLDRKRNDRLQLLCVAPAMRQSIPSKMPNKCVAIVFYRRPLNSEVL